MIDYFPSILLLEENRNCLYLQQIFMMDIKTFFFFSFLVQQLPRKVVVPVSLVCLVVNLNINNA